MTSNTIRVFFSCATIALASTVVSPSLATPILIDDFDTAQSLTATASSPTASSSVLAPEAIGGERDMELSLTGGFTSLSLSANPFGGGLLVHDSGATVTGSSTTVWDGPDDSPTIDYTGLGGIDLDTGLNAFELAGLVADLAGEIMLTVYDASDATGATSSSTTLTLPGGIFVPTDMEIPYADFTTAGLNGPADFSNVGAIRLAISNDATGSLDVIVGSISAVPEPSTMALGLIALGGLVAVARRR